MIYKLLAPFRVSKNKRLDAINKRDNFTSNKVTFKIEEDKDFYESTVQNISDNPLDNN